MKDIAFKEKELTVWKGLFNNAKVIQYQDAGHYPHEEKGDELSLEINKFIVEN